MSSDRMTPDRHGYVRVYVGGKYQSWERQVSVEPGDDVIFLAPIGDRVDSPVDKPDPNQLTLSDDENYGTIRLGE